MSLLRQFPRLLLLLCSMILAYTLYGFGLLEPLHHIPTAYSYLAIFIGGMLFSFGFTAAFGAAVFIEVGHMSNVALGAMVGGMGAMLADILIFHLLREQLFREEIVKLQTLRIIQAIQRMLYRESVPHIMRTYFLWIFAGIMIASPLPDECGVMLMSTCTEIKERTFAILCFILNTIGIGVLLTI